MEVAATALTKRLNMGRGRVCWRVSSVALGFPENLTKFRRWPMVSSMFPVDGSRVLRAEERNGRTFHHLLVGSCHLCNEEFLPHSGVAEVNNFTPRLRSPSPYI